MLIFFFGFFFLAFFLCVLALVRVCCSDLLAGVPTDCFALLLAFFCCSRTRCMFFLGFFFFFSLLIGIAGRSGYPEHKVIVVGAAGAGKSALTQMVGLSF